MPQLASIGRLMGGPRRGGAAAVGWVFVTSAMSPYQAVCGGQYDIDSSGGAVTVTMPLAPADGCTIQFRNTLATLTAHPLTIGRNGQEIANWAEDLIVDIDSVQLSLTSQSANWELTVVTLEQLLAYKVLATSAAMTRATNTTAYSQNDSISNSATAGSVTANPVTISSTNDAPVQITGLELVVNDTAFGGTAIRMLLFNSDPTANSGVVAGDNVAYSNKNAGYVGSLAGLMTIFSDGTRGVLMPETDMSAVPVETGGKRLWWQLQILSSSGTPTASSTFTPTFYGRQLAA